MVAGMANNVRLKSSGRYDAWVKKVKREAATHVKSVEAGFYSTARYPDGTPVTVVAATQEFGRKTPQKPFGKVPPRPFMSRAVDEIRPEMVRVVGARIDRDTGIVDKNLGRAMGVLMQREIQKSIRDGDWKPNSEVTALLKTHGVTARQPYTFRYLLRELARLRAAGAKPRGKSRPLIDTGFMRMSVAWDMKK